MPVPSDKSYNGQVFIVDDDEGVVELYEALLASVALPHRCFASGDAFLAEWSDDWWGAVVLDLRMPGMGGMAVLQTLRERQSPLAVIVVTGFGEIRSAVEAMQHGAVNYLEKPFSNEALLANVQKAIQESRLRYTQSERRRELARRYETLSPREREVALWVTRGLTSKEIAAQLNISLRTVEVHRAHVLTHLECDSSIEIAKLMLELDRLSGKGAVS